MFKLTLPALMLVRYWQCCIIGRTGLLKF